MCSSPPWNPVYTRRVDPSTLPFSLQVHHTDTQIVVSFLTLYHLLINNPWHWGDHDSSEGWNLVYLSLTDLLCHDGGWSDPHYGGYTDLGFWMEKNCDRWLRDHVNTCTVHSVTKNIQKKTHDCDVEQLDDLFHTTHKVKTQQVRKIRSQWCGDIEIFTYLITSLILWDRFHLCLTYTSHERWGSTSNPSLNGQLHYPNPSDIDRTLNETVDEKHVIIVMIIIVTPL